MRRLASIGIVLGTCMLGLARISAANDAGAEQIPKDTSIKLTSAQKVDRLWDMYQIQNLMSSYEYYHAAGMDEEVMGLWAQRAPGIRLEINRGVYNGLAGVRKFVMGTAKGEGDRIGALHLHSLSTPVIQVAADGKTAQGIWVSAGVETGRRPGDPKLAATWTWLKYGIDFVKEDGAWKFWHFNFYRVFSAPPGVSWTDVPPPKPSTSPDADAPAAFDPGYSPDLPPSRNPLPPTPYKTWDDTRTFKRGSGG
jgi:SnoaL-like domain